MHNIDFLPAEYRQKHAKRQSLPSQAIASLVIVALVAAAALLQQWRKRELQSELAVIASVYEAAMAQKTLLAETQQRLKVANAEAELCTYLHHPWPRTQLLSALAIPLPPAITLQQIQILREAPTTPTGSEIRPPIDAKAEEERLKSLSPAERDLAKLRRDLDGLQTVVVLTGTTTEIEALHRYIGALDATDIFKKAELDCFNSIDTNKSGDLLQFRAVLSVQPGYGQPGGPTPTESAKPSATIAEFNARRTSP